MWRLSLINHNFLILSSSKRTSLTSAGCIMRFLFSLGYTYIFYFWTSMFCKMDLVVFRFLWSWAKSEMDMTKYQKQMESWQSCLIIQKSVLLKLKQWISILILSWCWLYIYLYTLLALQFSLFCLLRLPLAWKSYSSLGYSRNPNQQMRGKILLRRMLVKRESQFQT